jgi:hypothetical protein
MVFDPASVACTLITESALHVLSVFWASAVGEPRTDGNPQSHQKYQ